MLTTCSICALPLSVPGPDDDGAWCSDCLIRNFGGQSLPEMPTPPAPLRLTPREVAALRLSLRHTQQVQEDRP